MNKKHLLSILLVPSCVLIIPAAAMLLKVEGWAWGPFDFVILWLILAAAVASYLFVASKSTTPTYRIGVALAVTTAVVLIWVNGAVGLIGNENNPANLMYGGVVAVGLISAALARLRAFGMARALATTAILQFLVPLVALLLWPSDFSPGVLPVLGLNACFVLMFSCSALLFRHAATAMSKSNYPHAA